MKEVEVALTISPCAALPEAAAVRLIAIWQRRLVRAPRADAMASRHPCADQQANGSYERLRRARCIGQPVRPSRASS
jgi:hypothetical protein